VFVTLLVVAVFFAATIARWGACGRLRLVLFVAAASLSSSGFALGRMISTRLDPRRCGIAVHTRLLASGVLLLFHAILR
jgi:hypothetical protein